MAVSNIFINPVFITQRALYKSIVSLIKNITFGNEKERWLDVGCGEKPYEHFFDGVRYVGMEVQEAGSQSPSKKCDLLYDGRCFPVKSGVIEGVICTQVLEHVPEPVETLLEINRVLKPGGHLLLTAPFLWEEHEEPYDFMRFSSYGLKSLLERAGFHLVSYHKSSGSVEAMFQMMSVYLSKNLNLRIPGWHPIVNFFICAPVQLLGYGLQKLLPDRGGLFLDSVVLAVKEI